MKHLTLGLLLVLFVGATNAFADNVTLTFNELTPRVANGVSIAGVTFGFSLNGAASGHATYNNTEAGNTQFIRGSALEGNASGALTLNFTQATSLLSFGVALSSFNTLSPGFTVRLFDASLNAIGTFNVTTTSTYIVYGGVFSVCGSGCGESRHHL